MNNQEDKKYTVLVVEDDFDLLWMIKKILSLQGYSILTAVTGEQAIDVFSRHWAEIKTVILDLSLPDQDGETLLAEIYKVLPEIPVVITTGSEDRQQQQRLEKAGIREYLIKPFDLLRLISVVADCTGGGPKERLHLDERH